MVTDSEFMLDCLENGRWWSLDELLRESFAKRGCGMTVHSRVSDLRAKGHVIEHRTVGRRGAGSQYRLIPSAVDGNTNQQGYNQRQGLREAREASGLSLRDVEARSGVSRAVLSEVERGIRVPTGTQLDAISETLDVPLVARGRPSVRVGQLSLLPDGPGRGAYRDGAAA